MPNGNFRIRREMVLDPRRVAVGSTLQPQRNVYHDESSQLEPAQLPTVGRPHENMMPRPNMPFPRVAKSRERGPLVTISTTKMATLNASFRSQVAGLLPSWTVSGDRVQRHSSHRDAPPAEH